MNPNVKVFVQALRDGKDENQCLTEYCWARLVLPIQLEDWKRNGMAARCNWSLSMASAMAFDAAEQGKSDEEIGAAFEDGLAIDHDRGVRFRPMQKHEQPTSADLIGAMSPDERSQIAEFDGFGALGRSLAEAEAHHMFPNAGPWAHNNLTRLIVKVRASNTP